MKKIILAIGVIILGLGFLLAGCGGTLGNSKEKVQGESGAYAMNVPADNPLFQFCSATSEHVHMLNSVLTVEAMINTNGGSGTVFSRGYGDLGSGSGIVLGVDPADGTAHFEAPDGDLNSLGTGGAGSTTVVNDGLWHHLAGVLVGLHPAVVHPATATCNAPALAGVAHVDIYVDGNLENCAAGAFPASIDDCITDGITEPCPNTIGRDLSTVVGAPRFIGIIDEVRLWKATRTQNQIMAWMESEIKGEEAWSIADPDNTIAGYWKFNEGTGQTATDSSGYGNNCAMFQCVGGTCGGQDEEFGDWFGAWAPGYPF